MSTDSINEPGSRLTSLTPMSINEPPTIADLTPPRITGINPAGCVVGDPVFTMDVAGTDFTDGMVVTIGGAAQPTTFISATELEAEIDPTNTVAGGYPVTVTIGAYEAVPAVMFTVTEAGAVEDEFRSTHAERPKTKKKPHHK